MRFFCVYVLKSLVSDYIYIGMTTNLYKKFKEHNEKKDLATKENAPYDLIYFEGYKYLNDAKRREEYLNTSEGRVSLKQILKENFSK